MMIARVAAISALVACSACQMDLTGGGSSGSATSGSGLAERLVLGSSMSYDQCYASGGLIIKDSSSPMVACDPRVKRRIVEMPQDEFNHPDQKQG